MAATPTTPPTTPPAIAPVLVCESPLEATAEVVDVDVAVDEDELDFAVGVDSEPGEEKNKQNVSDQIDR